LAHPNVELIHQFFEAYGRRDLDRLRQILSADVNWVFPGRSPLSGVKRGVDEVVRFFDEMGAVMGRSNVKAEALVSGVSDGYVVEAQHVWTNRGDGIELNTHWCVLWMFKDGKISEGRHLAADQYAADEFFHEAAGGQQI